MLTTINIPLPKGEKERLTRLAIRYGLSLPEFSRRVLQEITSAIPEESFEDYKNPNLLKASFQRALRDWQRGRVKTKL